MENLETSPQKSADQSSHEKRDAKKQKARREERIQLVLARAGLGSRREIEMWIQQNRITVNGKIAKLGQKVDAATDAIKVNGKLVHRVQPSATVVYVLNKPRGVVSTSKDPQGRTQVVDLVPKRPRVFPVGRLDLNSEGLILLTNDGDLALRLTHPRFEIFKTYEVKVRGSLDTKRLDFLRRGFQLGPVKYKGAEILSIHDVTQEGVQKHIVRLRIREGKNHHVRKMFEAVKCRVIRLKRVAIGNLELKGIAEGSFKRLNPQDIEKLTQAPSEKLTKLVVPPKKPQAPEKRWGDRR